MCKLLRSEGLASEPVQSLFEPLAGGDARLPTQSLPGAGDVRTALPGIVLGEWPVGDPALATGALYQQLGDLSHRVLDGVAEVHGTGLGAPHQPPGAWPMGSSTYCMLLVWEPSP